jgi:hypothetical protein
VEEHARATAMALHCEGEEKASEALPRSRVDKGNGKGARRCTWTVVECVAHGGREARGAHMSDSWRGRDVALAVGFGARSERCLGARRGNWPGGPA